MTQKALEKAYSYCQETLKLRVVLEEGFIELGKRLKKIRDDEMYKPSWESFPEFLMEMKMSDSVASRLITIYTRLVEEYQIDRKLLAEAGGWDRCYTITTVAKDKDEATEWLKKSGMLSIQDFRNEIQEKKTGLPQVDCKHKDTYTIKICRGCGLRTKIYDEE